jgi:hypothetical protein
LLHSDDQEEARKAWAICLSTGEAAEFSQRVPNAQGAYRWFLSRAEPLRTSDGTLLNWVGVNLEIEELMVQTILAHGGFASAAYAREMGILPGSVNPPIGAAPLPPRPANIAAPPVAAQPHSFKANPLDGSGAIFLRRSRVCGTQRRRPIQRLAAQRSSLRRTPMKFTGPWLALQRSPPIP